MKRVTAAAVLAAFCLSISPSGVLAQEKKEDGGENAEKQSTPAVIVAPATVQDLRDTASFTGRVASIQKIDVRARVMGFLEKIDFEEGDLVAEGDILYEIEPDQYIAAVNEISGTIGAAEAELRLAGIEVSRKTKLVERKAVAQSELDAATAQFDRLASQIVSLKANRDRAELDLSYTKIQAPFAGMIGLSDPDVGALVGPESGALTTLTKLDPINVRFPVATKLYLEYRKQTEGDVTGKGVIVRLRLPNGDEYEHNGEIDFVASSVSSGTDTVMLRAQFPNPDAILLDDALVTVNLQQGEPQMVIGVPLEAIQRDQQGFFVLVVDKQTQKADRRRVQVERNVNGQAVIGQGLEKGELVITHGANKVKPGQKVDAKEDDANPVRSAVTDSGAADGQSGAASSGQGN